jgi:hypothetical protein
MFVWAGSTFDGRIAQKKLKNEHFSETAGWQPQWQLNNILVMERKKQKM